MLRHVLPQVEWIELDGGATLFRQDDHDESLFFVVSGRLRASSLDRAGQRTVLGEIARGETVGEMAFFTGEPRTAAIVAIRDRVLARFSNVVFRGLLLAYPMVSLNMTRQVIERFKRVNAGRQPVVKPVIIGVLGITRNVDAAAFAQKLALQLQTHGKTTVVDSPRMDELVGGPGAAQAVRTDFERSRIVTVRLNKIEAQHDFVVLVADAQRSEWTQRYIRHCDELLLVADADEPAVQHPNEADLHTQDEGDDAQAVLVLLHPDGRLTPTNTNRWLQVRQLSDHCHGRRGKERDWQRLGRVVSRNTVGLVLAGGGAYGFAHLGVQRAMEEAGIGFDRVAGTSIGAVMAAYAAMDIPAQEMILVARKVFGESPTGYYNLIPLLSLVSGNRLRRIIGVDLLRERGQRYDLTDVPSPLELIRDKLRDGSRKYRLPSLTSLLRNTSMMYSYARQQESQSLVDLHFAPGVSKFGMLEWSKFDRIVDAGYRHAVAQLEQGGAAVMAPFRAA